MSQTRKEHHSTTPPDFPYEHVVNEQKKTIEISWNGNGQLARYGVPSMVQKYYPGYSYTFV
jgi:hypothetical protein